VQTALQYRTATATDTERIARLHAESWSENYRGALSDRFLDREVQSERSTFWKDRFENPIEQRRVLLAETNNEIVGFICLELDADPQYGALLDNLHVDARYQGRKIGKKLMQLGAEWVLEQRPESGIYLFVLAQNEQAARVYERTGGLRSDETLFWETEERKIPIQRFTWKRATTLLTATT
jgi:ribosomal protein S18 acetylase RimI-like enzyme